MFRDANEELKRLEEELLQEESEDDLEEVYEEEVYEETAVSGCYDPYRVYNGDDVDIDPEALSEELQRPRKKNGFGVAVCLLLLAAAMLLVAATVLRLRG